MTEESVFSLDLVNFQIFVADGGRRQMPLVTWAQDSAIVYGGPGYWSHDSLVTGLGWAGVDVGYAGRLSKLPRLPDISITNGGSFLIGYEYNKAHYEAVVMLVSQLLAAIGEGTLLESGY